MFPYDTDRKWFKKIGFRYAFPVTFQGYVITFLNLVLLLTAGWLFGQATTVLGAILSLVVPIGLVFAILWYFADRF